MEQNGIFGTASLYHFVNTKLGVAVKKLNLIFVFHAGLSVFNVMYFFNFFCFLNSFFNNNQQFLFKFFQLLFHKFSVSMK